MREPYEPSPIEIWRECVGIQAYWTREEERRRRDAGEEQWRLLERVSRASNCGTGGDRLAAGWVSRSDRTQSEFAQ
jgi:hypothetical protein